MKHAEGTFRGVTSADLYYQSWHPDGRARAVVAIVHGHGDHSGRYQNLANCLVPDNYAVYAYDLRGHGRSPGQRGYIDHWSDFSQDTGAFVRWIAEHEPGSPIFLFGHSLGGLIVLEYALRHPEGLAGVIASAPVVGKIGIPPILFLISRILSRIHPHFSLATTLDATALSRIPTVVKAYKEDPLVHDRGTARIGTEIVAAQEWTMEHAAEWRVPLLIIHGGQDRLSAPATSRAFFEKVHLPDKQRIEYEGAFHECHNDLVQDQVVADLKAWLDRHVGKGNP